jgi:hypothetical protein
MCDQLGRERDVDGVPESPNTDTDQDEDQDLNDTFPRYGNGDPLSDNPAEHDAYQLYLDARGEPPSHVDVLRAWVQDKAN